MEALLTFLEGAVIFVAGLLVRASASRRLRRRRPRAYPRGVGPLSRAGADDPAAQGAPARPRGGRRPRSRRAPPLHARARLAGRDRRPPARGTRRSRRDISFTASPRSSFRSRAACWPPGAPAVTVACGARTAVIPSPVTGTVVAVNSAVSRRPSLVESSPYGRGWLFSVRPASDTYRSFPTGAKARAWFHADETRLAHFLEGELGLAAADGGELVLPPPALLSEDQWRPRRVLLPRVLSTDRSARGFRQGRPSRGGLLLSRSEAGRRRPPMRRSVLVLALVLFAGCGKNRPPAAGAVVPESPAHGAPLKGSAAAAVVPRRPSPLSPRCRESSRRRSTPPTTRICG